MTQRLEPVSEYRGLSWRPLADKYLSGTLRQHVTGGAPLSPGPFPHSHQDIIVRVNRDAHAFDAMHALVAANIACSAIPHGAVPRVRTSILRAGTRPCECALIVESLAGEINRVRADTDFTERARTLLQRDKELLDRLAR